MGLTRALLRSPPAKLLHPIALAAGAAPVEDGIRDHSDSRIPSQIKAPRSRRQLSADARRTLVERRAGCGVDVATQEYRVDHVSVDDAVPMVGDHKRHPPIRRRSGL